ncbi:MAG TPA: DUF5681 domain-containing protein [Stellaceae bacterium]|nr:DUF5681 domain-containing protein [Stellaceae bacterium]
MPDKSLIGTGVTGSRQANATSFRKGQSGNPKGRPRGRFRAGTRAAALLLDGEAEALARKAVEMALGGDAVAVRFCLGRLLGARRGQPVELDLPDIGGAGDLAAAVATIASAVGDGRITPDEALALSQMLDGFPRVLAAGHAEAEARRVEEPREDPRQVLMQRLQRLADAGRQADV